MLMECLVYIAVFAILLGGGTAAFYFCWDHSKALIYATDDIASALHAGERWRADVRAATGKITVETTRDRRSGADSRRRDGHYLPLRVRRSAPPDSRVAHSGIAAGERQDIANGNGSARRRSPRGAGNWN